MKRLISGFFRSVLSILGYLVARTETHAYCGALAFFALIGFYPFCSVLLWTARYLLRWREAEHVIEQTLTTYYPEAPDFLLRNLSLSVDAHGASWQPYSIFWILLGAAGIFIPLETAFNGVWGVKQHRPYWRNQAVGFLLTAACVVLAILFVLSTAGVQRWLPQMSDSFLLRGGGTVALRLLAVAYSVMVIFLFYKFLPNAAVPTRRVFVAALFTGVAVEAVRALYQKVLPYARLQSEHGPFYVSASFVLLAYFLTFVVLGGAYLAADGRSVAEARD
jgi:uncharacterized BrkB/YihY/UPF0761 family membrane protein